MFRQPVGRGTVRGKCAGEFSSRNVGRISGKFSGSHAGLFTVLTIPKTYTGTYIQHDKISDPTPCNRIKTLIHCRGENSPDHMQHYKSLRAAVLICTTLVNTHTHRHTDTHTDRQTAFDRLYHKLSHPS